MSQFMRVNNSKIQNLHGMVKNYIDQEYRKFKADKPCELMEKEVIAQYYSEDGEPLQHTVTVLFVNSFFLYQYLHYHYCNDRPTIEKYFSKKDDCYNARITNRPIDFDLWFLMELYRDEIQSFNDMLSENKTLVPIRKIPQVKKVPKPDDGWALKRDTYIFLRNPFEDESINHSSDCYYSPVVVALKNTFDHINDDLNDSGIKRYSKDSLRQIADEMLMIPTSDEICQGLRQCLERDLAKVPNKEIQIPSYWTDRRYYYLQKFFNIVQDAKCCDIAIKDMQKMEYATRKRILELRYVFFNQFADKINLIGTYVEDLWRFSSIERLQPTFFSIITNGYMTDSMPKHMLSWITEIFNMYMTGCWLNDAFAAEHGSMIRSVLERYGLCIYTRTEEKNGVNIIHFENRHKSFIDYLDTILNCDDDKLSPWLETERQMKYNREYGDLISETQRLEDYLYGLLLENPETKKRYVKELQNFSFLVLLRLYWENMSTIEKIRTAGFRWDPITLIPNYRVAVELIYELFRYRYDDQDNPFYDINLVIPGNEFAKYLWTFHLSGGEYCMGHTLKDFPTINADLAKDFIGHNPTREPKHDQLMVALLYSICSDSKCSFVETKYGITSAMTSNFCPNGKTNQLCVAADPNVYLSIPESITDGYGTLTRYETEASSSTMSITKDDSSPYIQTRTLNLENCKQLAPGIKKLVQNDAGFKEALFSVDKYLFIKQMGLSKTIDGRTRMLTRIKDVDPSAILFISYIMSEK